MDSIKEDPEIVKELRKKEKLAYKTYDKNKITMKKKYKNLNTSENKSVDNLQNSSQKEFYEKYRIIAENTSDLISIVDFSLKPVYKYVSPSHKVILGYSEQELLGKSFFNFVHPEDKKNLLLILKKYLEMKTRKILTGNESKFVEKFSYRYKNKSGNWRVLESTANIFKNQIIAVSRDITDRKKKEEKLRKTKKQVVDILNATADGIRIVDKNYKIKSLNKTMAELIGIKQEESIGLTCKEILSSKFCGTNQCCLVKTLKDKVSFQREQKIIRKDGKEIPVLLKVTPIKDEKGEITGIIEDYRDITHIKKTQMELERNEKKFREFFENSPDYCYMVSTEGKILDINKTALDILGFDSKKQVIGRQIIPTIYAEESYSRAKELVEKWKKMGRLTNEEINIKTIHGIRYVLLSVDDVKDNHGHILYSILMQKDITDIKKTEEKLKEKIDELERYKKVTVGRELKMIELKKKIEELEEKCLEEKIVA